VVWVWLAVILCILMRSRQIFCCGYGVTGSLAV